jgi:hypothetical protein
MNTFKILIPKDNAQTVTELESYTLEWRIQGEMYRSEVVKHKSFINKNDAEMYEKQLKESAKFLGTWVKTNIYRN